MFSLGLCSVSLSLPFPPGGFRSRSLRPCLHLSVCLCFPIYVSLYLCLCLSLSFPIFSPSFCWLLPHGFHARRAANTLPRARSGPRAPPVSPETSFSRLPRPLKGEAGEHHGGGPPGSSTPPQQHACCGEADSGAVTAASLWVYDWWMGLPGEQVSSSGKV